MIQKNIPVEQFRFVLKGNKIIAVFTDNGVFGGSFWDTKYWDYRLCKKLTITTLD